MIDAMHDVEGGSGLRELEGDMDLDKERLVCSGQLKWDSVVFAGLSATDKLHTSVELHKLVNLLHADTLHRVHLLLLLATHVMRLSRHIWRHLSTHHRRSTHECLLHLHSARVRRHTTHTHDKFLLLIRLLLLVELLIWLHFLLIDSFY